MEAGGNLHLCAVCQSICMWTPGEPERPAKSSRYLNLNQTLSQLREASKGDCKFCQYRFSLIQPSLLEILQQSKGEWYTYVEYDDTKPHTEIRFCYVDTPRDQTWGLYWMKAVVYATRAIVMDATDGNVKSFDLLYSY